MEYYTFINIFLLNWCIWIYSVLMKLSYIRYLNKKINLLLTNPMHNGRIISAILLRWFCNKTKYKLEQSKKSTNQPISLKIFTKCKVLLKIIIKILKYIISISIEFFTSPFSYIYKNNYTFSSKYIFTKFQNNLKINLFFNYHF